VAADDVYWLLEHTASQIKAAQSSRDRDLELTEAVYAKSNSIIEKALTAGGHLTREELVAELNKANIATDQNRAAHLLARAELEKIICSGVIRKGKPTYALLSERVPKTKQLTKDEALAELARRYFTSRCPATLQDFSWWSGLPARDANRALESVRSDFHPEIIEGSTYWLTNHMNTPKINNDTFYLLPTYDEFILSYSDRGASIPVEYGDHLKAISDRGVFRPIMVENGQVMGIWRRTIKKGKVMIEIEPFKKTDQIIRALILEAARQYGYFISKESSAEISGWHSDSFGCLPIDFHLSSLTLLTRLG
jgi:hypothetical protein